MLFVIMISGVIAGETREKAVYIVWRYSGGSMER